jgi:hypothetical protein
MKDNKPCRDAQGRYFWPKIYVAEESKTKAVSSIDQGEKEIFSETEYSSSLKDSSNPRTRTAAPVTPPGFWV